MKIVQEPDVYGVTAKTGLFISFDELNSCHDILKAIRKAIMSSLKKAHKRLTHFVDIRDSGEATSRQCDLMFKYEEKCCELDLMIDTLDSSMDYITKEGGAQ